MRKIVVDGLNLGTPDGTGLSVYARGLRELHAACGFGTGVLYGKIAATRRGWRSRQPTPEAFFQSLLLGRQGRPDPSGLDSFVRLALACPGDLARQFVRAWPRPLEVPFPPAMERRGLEERLPPGSVPLNLPLAYERAFAHFSLTGSFLRFRAGDDTAAFHATRPLPILAADRPNICTFHDIIPLVLPGHTEVDLLAYRRLCEAAVRQYDLVIADSEHTRQDLIAGLGADPGKIAVVPIPTDIQAVNAAAGADGIDRLVLGNGLQPGGYLLFVGSLEPRKNLVRLVRAYAASHSTLPLVIVGKDGWMFEEIHKAMAPYIENAAGAPGRSRLPGKRIIRLNFLPRADVAALIARARMLLFPSLYEGFGLPVLEAMALGCPTVTSSLSSLPEVAGGASLLVDPYDVRQIAAAIDRLSADENLRRELSARGLEQAGRFTPAHCAAQLAQAYGRAGVRLQGGN